MKRRSLLLTILVILLLSAATLLSGQTTTATVYGHVTDRSQAVIPGATVKLVNNSKHVVMTASSNTHGEFTFNFVPNGSYTLIVQRHGFQSLTQTDLTLTAGQNLRLNLTMQVGQVEQTVTVQAPLVNAVNPEQHNTIGTEQVHQLPMQHSDWTGLLQLTNGVAQANQGVSVNGLPPSGFTLTVNGTSAASDPEESTLGVYQNFDVIKSVNTDAIAEISVTKGIAPASQGQALSGNVNIITKSGGNAFHGDLFYGNQNDHLSARGRFLNANHLVYNQFGGSLGGPIIRNKAFFFADAEGVTDHSAVSVSGNVPTSEFKQQAIAAIPASAAFLNLYPAPTSSYTPGSVTGFYRADRAQLQDDNNEMLRLDDYLNSNNMLTAMYVRSRPYLLQPNVIPTGGRAFQAHNDKWNVALTHSAASWTSQTRFGYNRMWLLRQGQRYSPTVAAILGLGFKDGQSEIFHKDGFNSSIAENIALTRGRNSIQFGGSVTRINSGRTDLETPAVTYSSESALLANTPSNVFAAGGLVPFMLHQYYSSLFFQDDYKLTPSFTLNMGLRYDYFSVPKERNGLLANHSQGGFGPLRPVSSMYNADFTNFQPRVGFAWALGGHRTTVIRGGSGIFASPHPIYGGPIEIPINPSGVPFEVNFGQADAQRLGLQYPVTNAEVVALAQSGPPLSNSHINSHFPNPYDIQWTLGVQHQFSSSMLGDITYVGNHALDLNMVTYQNLPNRLTGVSPVPGYGIFRNYGPDGNSTYEGLQMSFQKRFSGGLTYQINDTVANNRSNGVADNLLNAPPQDNNNLRAEIGPTPFDVRNSFTTNFVYDLPFAHMMGTQHGGLHQALNGWQVSGILTATSGLPVNVTQSSSYRSSRPDLVSGVSPYESNYSSTLQYLNPNAFANVPVSKASGAPVRDGTLGRDALRAPGLWNLDLALAKNFALNERMHLQFRADAFDSLNHTNLTGLQLTSNRGTFGQLTSATPPRILQLNLKLTF